MDSKCLSGDGFTVVNRRRKGNKRKPPSGYKPSVNYNLIDQSDGSDCDDQEFTSKLQYKLDKCIQTLKRVRFVDKVVKELSKYGSENVLPTMSESKSDVGCLILDFDKCCLKQFGQVVSYGIGRFSSRKESLHQLSLLLILKNENLVTADEWLIYDPVFTNREKQFLYNNGFKIMDINEKGARRINLSTFFYMPHCPIPMYNNLLWSNWSSFNLSRMVLLGTSFASLTTLFIDSDDQKNFSYLIHANQDKLIDEYPLDPPREIYESFNDLSIHLFKPVDTLEESLAKIDLKDTLNYENSDFSTELIVE